MAMVLVTAQIGHPMMQTKPDNDGVGDNADAFPNDDSETLDTDGDGVGDNAQAIAEAAAAKQKEEDEKRRNLIISTWSQLLLLALQSV